LVCSEVEGVAQVEGVARLWETGPEETAADLFREARYTVASLFDRHRTRILAPFTLHSVSVYAAPATTTRLGGLAGCSVPGGGGGGGVSGGTRVLPSPLSMSLRTLRRNSSLTA
jgi:hypothetical protein